MVPSPVVVIGGALAMCAASLAIVVILVAVFWDNDLGPNDACRDPVTGEARPVASDVTYAETFQRTWNESRGQLEAGANEVTLPYNESEVTSRVREFIALEDTPLSDIIICFHDGSAEARATVELPGASDLPLIGGLFQTEARIAGTIDLSGAYPLLVLTDFEAAGVPGALEDAVRDEAEAAANDRLRDLDLQFTYGVAFAEGLATVSASQ